tara:strand:+ start:267 stop:389 length:123 start_codon:yes stop_codon:yes gene_type:complete
MRQAHNLKVAGSNQAPATNYRFKQICDKEARSLAKSVTVE